LQNFEKHSFGVNKYSWLTEKGERWRRRRKQTSITEFE
jgi:hypothetical protein